VSASNITSTSGSFGNLVIGNSSFTNITVTNLASLNNVSASNQYITSNLTVNGTSTLTTISSSNGNFTNNLSINNVLSAYSASITNLQIGGTAPTTTNDSGITGSVRYDNDFAYVYTNGKWKRTPLSVY
jgi:hypothetical protein